MTDDFGLAGTRELNRLRVMQALLRNPGSSRNDVARLTGLSLRQIDYWAKTGLIDPSIALIENAVDEPSATSMITL